MLDLTNRMHIVVGVLQTGARFIDEDHAHAKRYVMPRNARIIYEWVVRARLHTNGRQLTHLIYFDWTRWLQNGRREGEDLYK